MDHGSRNKDSNDRLHELARVYQLTVGSNVIVTAAHMEIASPSIPEGLETLLNAGVGKLHVHETAMQSSSCNRDLRVLRFSQQTKSFVIRTFCHLRDVTCPRTSLRL